MTTNYRFVLIDEFGGAVRKFATKQEAQPYLTSGAQLRPLPKEQKISAYQLAMQTLGEALF